MKLGSMWPATVLCACSATHPVPLPPDAAGADADTAGPSRCIDDDTSTHNDLMLGGLIAFTRNDSSHHLQIFTARPDGSQLTQLTFEGDNGRPDWSPDGRKLAFMAHRDPQTHRVGIMNADGSDLTLVAPEGQAPDFSPDGGQIAFSRAGDIWVMNADGSAERRITQGGRSRSAPSWSPDGKQMVFIVVQNPGSPSDPRPTIGIMNADGTEERILTDADRTNLCAQPDGTVVTIETAHDANAPSWSPVDDRIAFWSGIENQYGQVWTIHSDGSGSRQLTEQTQHRNSDDPSWSADGKKILFGSGRSGRNELWVMDADGCNEMRLFAMDAFPFPGRAAWQPVP